MNRILLSRTVAALMLVEASLSGAQTQLVSTRSPLPTLPEAANSDSVDPRLTPDGRFVLFASAATDLTTNNLRSFAVNLFLRDYAANRTTLVSVNPGGAGGNGHSAAGMVSTNGRYVVYQSDATDLVPGDTNAATDIFLRDLVAGTTTLISVAPDGSVGSAASTDPLMTPDGRFVVFISAATNLVPHDTNGIADVFVRDTWSNSTVLVSVGAGGLNSVMGTPRITPDGNRIVFFSTATGLAPGVPPLSKGELYLRDLAANSTVWVSTNAANLASNLLHLSYMPSYHPALSEDGTVVAFKTGWTNGASQAPPFGIPKSLIFRFDLTTGASTLVSTNAFPRWAYSDDVYGPEMTADGRLLVFVETNEAPINSLSVVLWDAQTGTNLLLSAAPDGSLPTNSISTTPVLSGDGKFAAFLSSAPNLVTNTVSSGFHIYLCDLRDNTKQLVDADTHGVGSADVSGTIPSLDAGGSLVAFSAPDLNFTTGDNGNDIFLRDTLSPTTYLISQRNSAAVPHTGNAMSSLDPGSISADGRWLVFSSFASDLAANDLNDNPDIFVADLQSGSNSLVSVGLDGHSAIGPSYNPVISADGRRVAFVSTAANLVTNQTDAIANLFVRDLGAQTTTWINAGPGRGDVASPVISSNGQYLAFLCQTNQSTAFSGTFWCDLAGGTLTLLSGASALAPCLSADGQRVAYFDSVSNLYVWDARAGATIYTNPAKAAFAALAPAGNRLLWASPGKVTLTVYDLAAGSNLFSVVEPAGVPRSKQGASPWSHDGRFLAFATTASLVPMDTNLVSDVYLCDFESDRITLISANYPRTSAANGPSDVPALSADARFILFRSLATDLVPGNTTPPGLFVFDRTTGATSALPTGSGDSWTSWISRPTVSDDGKSVAFQGWDSGLVTGDLNRAPDVFAQSQAELIVDSDSDGIPDWWMLKYFGHPTGLAGDQSRAQDDADGNGMTNLEKYLTGINPLDPRSVFALQISTPAPNDGSVSLTWPAVPGRGYQLQYTDDLSQTAWRVFNGNLTVVGWQGSVTLPGPPAARFYRVVCLN